MKRFFKLFVLFMIVLPLMFFAGCKDEICGEWKICEYRLNFSGQEFVYQYYELQNLEHLEQLPENADAQTKANYYVYEMHKINGESKMIFKEDGKVDVYNSNGVSYDTYTRKGAMVQVRVEIEQQTIELTMTYKDKTIFAEYNYPEFALKMVYKRV